MGIEVVCDPLSNNHCFTYSVPVRQLLYINENTLLGAPRRLTYHVTISYSLPLDLPTFTHRLKSNSAYVYKIRPNDNLDLQFAAMKQILQIFRLKGVFETIGC